MLRPDVGDILWRLEDMCLEADEDQMGKDKLHLMRELHAVNEELKRVQSNFEQLQVEQIHAQLHNIVLVWGT